MIMHCRTELTPGNVFCPGVIIHHGGIDGFNKSELAACSGARETQSEITARARGDIHTVPVGGLSAQLSDAINQSYSRLALLGLM